MSIQYLPSLEERKKKLIEDCMACGGGPGMTVGADGFEGSAPAEGPKAGFDPILAKALKKVRRAPGGPQGALTS